MIVLLCITPASKGIALPGHEALVLRVGLGHLIHGRSTRSQYLRALDNRFRGRCFCRTHQALTGRDGPSDNGSPQGLNQTRSEPLFLLGNMEGGYWPRTYMH